MRYRLSSGYMYTPNALRLLRREHRHLPAALGVSRPYNSRLPLFHSLDVRVDKTWASSRWGRLSAYLDVLNVYNQGNVDGVSYDYNYTHRPTRTTCPSSRASASGWSTDMRCDGATSTCIGAARSRGATFSGERCCSPGRGWRRRARRAVSPTATLLTTVRILASSADPGLRAARLHGDGCRCSPFDGRPTPPEPMTIYWLPFVCEDPADDAYYACFQELGGGDAGAPAGDGGGASPGTRGFPAGADITPFLPTGPSYQFFRCPSDVVSQHTAGAGPAGPVRPRHRVQHRVRGAPRARRARSDQRQPAAASPSAASTRRGTSSGPTTGSSVSLASTPLRRTPDRTARPSPTPIRSSRRSTSPAARSRSRSSRSTTGSTRRRPGPPPTARERRPAAHT